MTKSPDIEELIPYDSLWHVTEGGFARYANIHKLTTGTFDLVPEEKLETIQPGLGHALRIMDKETQHLFGVYLHQALSIWHNGMTVLSTDGRQVALTKVNSFEQTRKFLRFKGSSRVYKEVLDPISGEKYRLPIDGATKITTVSREWMDSTYPGWDKRFMIMETLGVEEELAIASIFSKQVFSEEVALPADMSI